MHTLQEPQRHEPHATGAFTARVMCRARATSSRARAARTAAGLARAAGCLAACTFGLVTASTTAALAAPPSPAVSVAPIATPDDVRDRTSELSQTPEAAWTSLGFEIGTGFDYEAIVGVGGAPTARAIGFQVEPAYRLTPRVALGARLQYGVLRGGLGRMRWRALVMPTFRPLANWTVGAGVGYAGFLAPVNHSTADSGQTKLDFCDGSGVSVVASTRVMMLLSDGMATGPVASATMQWTNCEDSRTVPATPAIADAMAPLTELTVTERWRQWGISLGWVVEWR